MTDETLAKLQGAYYVGTGLWPLFHMRSFLRVTGPKTDLWLVRTVGVLVTCIGAQMLLASKRRNVTPETKLLAASSAAGLAAIEVVHVARKTISPIYLLDAVGEVALAGLWGARSRSGTH